jgi:HEXXH motif-containing protein
VHRITVTAADVAAVAAGTASPAVEELLHTAQRSSRKLLLRLALSRHRSHPAVAAAARTLRSASTAAPVAVDALMDEPLVGVRAGRCVDGPLRADTVAGLQGLAAVAAMRARITATVPVTVLDGRVVLPTLGVLTLPGAAPGAPASVPVRVAAGRCRIGSVTVSVADELSGLSPGWRPRRRLRAEAAGRLSVVALEDQDPGRDCYGMPVADVLSDGEHRAWSVVFGEAWRLLAAYHDRAAADIARYLTVLVPLAASAGAAGLSATARDAYGAVALTAPAHGAGMAVTLLHERQHALCHTVQDLVPLARPNGRAHYFAPWRSDARPIDGLIHGTLAFLAVAEGWDAFRADRGLRPLAEQALADTREQLDVAIRQLIAAPELTAAGRAFSDGLVARFRRLAARDLPAEVVHRALLRLQAQQSAWRRAHPMLPEPTASGVVSS